MSGLQRKLRREAALAPVSLGRTKTVSDANFADAIRDIAAQNEARKLPPPERLGVPQLIITLSPNGALQAELPGSNGARRVVALREADFYSSCVRMLQSISRREIEIGLDGAPTQAQIKHWEQHQIFPEPSCHFCLAEGRASRQYRRVTRRDWLGIGDGSVKVRRLAPKGKAKRQQGDATLKRLRGSLEDLGL